MKDTSLQLNKEALNERDGVTSSYTDMNEIGLFTDSFRTKINLHNGSRDKDEAIVNSMMFTHTDVATGYYDANDLMFLNRQELVIHREPTAKSRYNVSAFGMTGVLLLLMVVFVVIIFSLKKVTVSR